MERKGIIFGEAKPVVCVPVIEKTGAAVLAQVRKLADRDVPMIEWRMDWYEGSEDIDQATALLQELAKAAERSLLLCTYRTRAQGGEGSLGPKEYRKLNLAAAESGAADLVDLEFFQVQEPARQIRELQEKGVWVVCSNHNFRNTPSLEEMEGQLIQMAQEGGNFAKLAVMPRQGEDVLRLMEAVLSVKRQLPKSHFIAMSMGELGAVSRILGGWYGSEVTFASCGSSSAPGQMPFEDVAKLLEGLKLCGRAL